MLLVTTSHSILRLDPATGRHEPVHRGLGLYYGIADDGTRTYVAARERSIASDLSPHDEQGRILAFDRSMTLVERIAPPLALRDVHEIMWHDGRLWVTCSFDNMVFVGDLSTGHWETWHPLGPTPEAPWDVNHFNSLAVDEGTICVLAHNFGQSELMRFAPDSRQLVSRTPFGRQAHNLRRIGGRLITCSSEEGMLLGDDGWRLEVGGFPRGLLAADGEIYVGVSEVAEREQRDLTSAHIAVFDAEWNRLRTIPLLWEGMVLDIQLGPS